MQSYYVIHVVLYSQHFIHLVLWELSEAYFFVCCVVAMYMRSSSYITQVMSTIRTFTA